MLDIPLFDFSNYFKEDSIISKTYISDIMNMSNIVVCEMLDGEIMSISANVVRSSVTINPNSKRYNRGVYNLQNHLKDWLDDYQIIGVNQTAIRQINYKKLDDFFYVYAIKKNGYILSWDETQLICDLLGLSTIPVKQITSGSSFKFTSMIGDAVRKSADYSIYDSCDPLTGVRSQVYGVYVRNLDSFYVDDSFNNHFLYIRKGRIVLGPYWEKNWKQCDIQGNKKYYLS